MTLEPLYQYMYLVEIRQENAYIQLENNLGLRSADYYDHLEMILQKHEIEVTNRIFQDIRVVLRIIQGGNKNGN